MHVDSDDEGNDEMACVRSEKVVSFHGQQAGEVPWEANCRDKVMRGGKSGC